MPCHKYVRWGLLRSACSTAARSIIAERSPGTGNTVYDKMAGPFGTSGKASDGESHQYVVGQKGIDRPSTSEVSEGKQADGLNLSGAILEHGNRVSRSAKWCISNFTQNRNNIRRTMNVARSDGCPPFSSYSTVWLGRESSRHLHRLLVSLDPLVSRSLSGFSVCSLQERV